VRRIDERGRMRVQECIVGDEDATTTADAARTRDDSWGTAWTQ
jgi:hypothetical protein